MIFSSKIVIIELSLNDLSQLNAMERFLFEYVKDWFIDESTFEEKVRQTFFRCEGMLTHPLASKKV